MEQHYKQALTSATAEAENDLSQQVATLTSHCQNYESRTKELLSDLETIKQDKDQLLNDLKTTQDQLSGTTEAFLKLQSDTEAIVNSQHQLDSLKSEIAKLESSLEVSQQEVNSEREAKTSALNELSKAKQALESSVMAEPRALDNSQLDQENKALRAELSQAERRIQELSAHEIISPTHSTPQGTGAAPSIRAELYDGTQYSDELSSHVSGLRQDLDSLQAQYNRDTSVLRQELESERRNVENLREEMRSSLNNSSSAGADTSVANLSDLVASLQSSNDRLNAEKQELNKQLSEQERLCERLHERLGASEALSTGVQESYAKQLAAAQKQRDEILQQLEEACRVNDQVRYLFTFLSW